MLDSEHLEVQMNVTRDFCDIGLNI